MDALHQEPGRPAAARAWREVVSEPAIERPFCDQRIDISDRQLRTFWRRLARSMAGLRGNLRRPADHESARGSGRAQFVLDEHTGIILGRHPCEPLTDHTWPHANTKTSRFTRSLERSQDQRGVVAAETE